VTYRNYISQSSFSVVLLIFFAIIVLAGVSLRALESRWYANIGQLQLARAMMTTSETQKQVAATNSEKWLRNAIFADGNNTAAQRGLGFALLAQGREDEAVEAWGDDLMFLETIVRGNLFFNNSFYSSSLKWYELASKISPENWVSFYKIGLVYSKTENWFEAVRYQKEAIARCSGNRDPWFELGMALSRIGNFNEARKVFSVGALLDDGEIGRSDIYYQIGKIELEQGLETNTSWEKAQYFFDQALEQGDFSNINYEANTLHAYGKHFASIGQKLRAIKYYEKELSLTPNRYWTRIALGDTYFKSGQTNPAKIEYKIAQELNPKLKWSYIRLADIYLSSGDKELAKNEYVKFLNIVPGDQVVLDALHSIGSE